MLWITGEHYVRDKPLSYHARYLPRDVMWYADPSEPGTICELRCAGFTIQKADNAQNPGISAVHSRIEAGTLKIIGSACPNLVFLSHGSRSQAKRCQSSGGTEGSCWSE